MKRTAALCITGMMLMVFPICQNIYAATQRTYQKNSGIWQNTDLLCRLTGVIGPSTVSPVPESEIIKALDRIDKSMLTDSLAAVYDKTRASVETPEYILKEDALKAAIRFNLEGYIHGKNTREEEFFVPYRDRAPMLVANAGAEFSGFFHLEGQFDFRNCLVPVPSASDPDCVYMDSCYNGEWMLFRNQYGGYYFFGNHIGGTERNDGEFSYQQSVPFLAYASAGNDSVSLMFGRNRQSFGNGITGNMLLGDNFSYQDMVRLSALSEHISYTLSYTHFGTQYADHDRPGQNAIGTFGFNGWHSVRVIHRLDFSFLEKVRLSLNHGASFFTDSSFDPRMFNPLMIVHGYLNNREEYKLITKTDSRPDESNNIMSIELDLAPFRGFSMSFQCVLDQVQVINERDTSVPNAWGLLLNMKYSKPLKNGVLDFWAEGVYANPYLYLNYKEGNKDSVQASDDARNYNYDHVLGYYISDHSEVGYTGYVWGPDCITAAAGVKYSNALHTVSLDSIVRIKGEKGINYAYLGKGPGDVSSCIKNPDMKAKTPTGIPWISWNTVLGCEYRASRNLNLYFMLCSSFNWNYHNESSLFRFYPEAVIGLTWIIV